LRFEAVVEVRTKAGIADPEGATIEAALPALGFAEVGGVSVGKSIRLWIDAPDENQARTRLEELCGALLANPVMEDSVVTLVQGAPA
jgi:phosphoribosylformylglycinamidine synthase